MPQSDVTPDLFGDLGLPDGFRYQSEVMAPADERALLAHIAALDLRPFQFHGFVGRRRTVSFGWRYDFSGGGLEPAPAIPDFLLPLRARAAHLAAADPESFEHALVTEYAPGAAIGWHRDRVEFGQVVGISLASAATFRLRRRTGGGWQRASVRLAPRSAYLLSGAARHQWEHSIPAVDSLRYSITFRRVRAGKRGEANG